MSSYGRKQDDGLLTWMLLAMIAFGVMGSLLWFVKSHSIVYYSAKIFDLIAFPWRLLPTERGEQAVADLDLNYILAMRHAGRFQFGDWVSYANLALRPWSYVFIGAMGLLTLRQFKKISRARLNHRLSPKQLAKISMSTFTEIAPVLNIQEQLVKNKLKGWERQTFPQEFLQKAKYQNRPVLITNEHGVQILDSDRLKGHLKATKTYRFGGKKLMVSHHLGRQLVDLRVDLERLKKEKTVCFVDRLSNEAKVLIGILAPYAFNKKENSREESAAVKDAVNLSAYGSKDGLPNLSIEIAQKSFDTWRTSAELNRLAIKHHWEYPFLYSLLTLAQKRGKIGTWWFIWLKPINRVMYYSLNTVGRATPHAEAALCFSQHQFDLEVAKQGRLPVSADLVSAIYCDQVVKSFSEEWKFWLKAKGDDVDDEQSASIFEFNENDVGAVELKRQLEQSQVIIPLPPSTEDN